MCDFLYLRHQCAVLDVLFITCDYYIGTETLSQSGCSSVFTGVVCEEIDSHIFTVSNNISSSSSRSRSSTMEILCVDNVRVADAP